MTPVSPPSVPAQWLFQELAAESKLMAERWKVIHDLLRAHGTILPEKA